MKKTISILLALMLVFSLSAVAFADNFVSSVANAGAPELAKAADADGNDADLSVTPNDEAEKLPEETQKEMDAAFKALDEAEDLAGVNDELKKAADGKNVAVSDLFDISANGDVKFPLNVTLKNKNLANFVGLLHWVNGQFKWVDAAVNGDELSFTLTEEDGLSPFAIIVAADEAESPKTGETIPYGFIIGAVVLAGAAGWFFTKSRKVKA